MSRVLLGRGSRCAGTAVAALILVCNTAPALGRGTGSARPRAEASRACAHASSSVWKASAGQLRAAVVCLINRARARRGLPWLSQQGQLDGAAQSHTDQMVADNYFAHSGITGSSPALRISASGFNWGAYGEAISTGFRTPWNAVQGWLASTEHCQILLSPQYRYIGIGVNPRGVAGVTSYSGTWTADLALPLGWGAPSGNWGPANGCPY